MARKQFVVHYPDRSKANISRTDRDSQLLSFEIEPTAQPNEYRYIGESFTCHNFADLSKLKEKLLQPIEETGGRFLPGSFIFELAGRKLRELEERPGVMVCRLKQQGAFA